MIKLSEIFNKFFKKKASGSLADIDYLRNDFKSRYHCFRVLLSSNNKALEIMADIELLLEGKKPFGITHIKSHCTAASVNVFKMIKNFDELAPKKYAELFSRFNAIQQQINLLLSQKKPVTDNRLVIPLALVNKNMADIIGSKMANIGEIKNRLHLTVPPGFVITSAAYDKLLSHNDLQTEIDRLFQTTDTEDMEQLYTLSSKIRQMIMNSKVPKELEDRITESLTALENRRGKKLRLALRSSAIGEDTAKNTFAGLYHSELNVGSDNIIEAYKNVVAGKYSLQAITYRLERGFRDEDIQMSVGCMEMVDAIAGGVMYTRNPVNMSDDYIFINSAWGLPKSVVDGSIDCDLFIVSKKSPIELIHKDIKVKPKKFICYYEEGVCRMDNTGESKDLPSLAKEQMFALSDTAIEIEKYYGCPQDIEWAVADDGSVYMLQCRPLQISERYKEIILPGIAEKDSTVIIKGGITSSPGVGFGKVFHVDKAVDILKFPDGAVLVARQALPAWAPLLNRASAVVTEQGGFAGHLANVAREIEVPALFGVPGVYDKLIDGELITVDANGLAIHAGEIESLAEQKVAAKNLMKNSPVYDILKDASRLIVPLNLLDPDSRYFKPINCKSLHDITRFIHEKSVQEMFSFGKEHNFSERSGKQLVYKVPMQWWVLNLDDGFKEEVEGKRVHLDNIVSVPMLAIWDGIISFPWEGPPPVDGKGFANVMFQATLNPALETGVRSKYAERNYFMISKYFCNLSSRLGFHFSIIESIVCDREAENYISFQFKGGAADQDRKLKRVLFLAEILEEYGFRVTVKKDSLFSRIDNREREFMEQRLKILGYLTIHTRQIDMIMSKESTVKYYKNKFAAEIEQIIGKQQ
ncbi:PEP/pyruvate-binding domain-containing protein [Desulfobacterium sp. N47]|uniref:Phosphoenolpyruvate synthase n=1 Tax=uncultured Desulfobacterium sp. TaxID=201089 RepID=E1YE27_9BACT|nr:hypothetical protein N47_B21030 [uncultured Desulfobacterium sp.]